MCGILGTIPASDENIFIPALNTLEHRGPDGFGVWHDTTHISLGHRRLAILDLSDKGKQPMENQRYAITFNGEIYNFLELKAILQKKGHQFYSDSDTEVILAGFQEWGVGCLHQFNGMWAMAIWDKQEKKLFLARDRFGVKPLFYAFTPKVFVFASEMKAIAPFLPEIKLTDKFNWFLANQHEYENTPDCLVQGIQRFPTGSYAFLENPYQKLQITKYWDTLAHISPVTDTYEKQVQTFQELFFDACRLRMRADVKLGTALSGGLDSSAVICAMAHIQKNQNLRTSQDWQNAFVATFKGTVLDEKEYAEEVVKFLGIKGIFKEIDATKGIQDLDNYLWYFEELFETSPIPMIEIYKAIRQAGVIVSLDGHGGDELLSGYGNTILQASREIPFQYAKIKELVQTFKQTFVKDRGEAESNTNFSNVLKHLIDAHGGRKNFLKDYFQYAIGNKSKENLAKKQLGRFNHLLYEMYHQTILPTLLRNYDRYSMAASIEVRMPFLDYRLVSYAFSLPWHSKTNKGFTKAILRDALQGYMPESVRTRKSKIGFGTPFADWMRGAWKEYLLDEMNSQAFKEFHLTDNQLVKQKVEQVINNPQANFKQGFEAWQALTPYFWYKGFFIKLNTL